MCVFINTITLKFDSVFSFILASFAKLLFNHFEKSKTFYSIFI